MKNMCNWWLFAAMFVMMLTALCSVFLIDSSFKETICQSASERVSEWVSDWGACETEREREREREREAIENCVDTCFIFYSSQPLVTMDFAQINMDLWGIWVCDCYWQEFFTGWPALSWWMVRLVTFSMNQMGWLLIATLIWFVGWMLRINTRFVLNVFQQYEVCIHFKQIRVL